jgi:hypothetical protein
MEEEEAEQLRRATRSMEKYLEKDGGEGKRVKWAEKRERWEAEHKVVPDTLPVSNKTADQHFQTIRTPFCQAGGR